MSRTRPPAPARSTPKKEHPRQSLQALSLRQLQLFFLIPSRVGREAAPPALASSFRKQYGEPIPMGTLHLTLYRLVRHGLISSVPRQVHPAGWAKPTVKPHYRLTPSGLRARSKIRSIFR